MKSTSKNYLINHKIIDQNGKVLPITQKNATSGIIQLTKLDNSKKIVSGSFSCVIPIESCDSLRVTDGRFDIIYR